MCDLNIYIPYRYIHTEWYRVGTRRRMVTWVQAEHSRVYQSCRWVSSCPGGPTYRLVASAKEKPVLMVQWYTAPCTSVIHISHAHQSRTSVMHINHVQQSCTSPYFMHSPVTGKDT